jgi:TolA-binding protein
MSRQAELKENVLASKLEGIVVWILANRSIVLTVMGVAAAAVLVGSVFVIRRNDLHDANVARIAQAQSLLSAGDSAGAAKILDEARTSGTRGPIAVQADYFRGVAALNAKQFDDAIRFFNEAVLKATGSPLKPLALTDLAFAYEQKHEYDAAARTYGEFMAEFNDHFLAPRNQLALGRTLTEAGKPDEARKALSQLVDLYPSTEWAENARALMDKNKSR